MKLTAEQQAAIEVFRGGKNTKVNAFAGTGKTTTLEEMARACPLRNGLYLAFNTSIADDARGKFPQNVEARTTHSYAYRSLDSRLRTKPGKLGKSANGSQISERLNLEDFPIDSKITVTSREMGHLVNRTIARYCQSCDPDVGAQHVPILGKLRLLDDATWKAFGALVAELAQQTWLRMRDPDDALPLTHDGYLKLWSLERPTIDADFVLLDEAQDSNAAVLDVLSDQKCQVIYVGDRHQQIYAWRGAVNAMEKARADAECKLTQSFRFGDAIARIATNILYYLNESTPVSGSPEVLSRINDGCVNAILCRTNVGVLSVLLNELSRNRKPYVVKGVNELSTLLEDVERLIEGKPGATNEFFGFTNWREVEDFAASTQDQSLGSLVKIVRTFSVQRLLDGLRRVAGSEREADFTVSTAHKTKGLQWSGVEVHSDFVHKDAKGQVRIEVESEETRLLYVAATRARHSLHIPHELLHELGATGGVPKASDARRFFPRDEAERSESPSCPVQGLPSIDMILPDVPAKKVGEIWGSKTGSEMRNMWIDAQVIAAKELGENIQLTYIDLAGHKQTITDYGRHGLRREVLNYLQSNVPARKVFLLTFHQAAPAQSKLASDTMLLPQHRRQWRT